MWPRITIVTPSYNQGRFLEETILSVINQDYPNLEYFIIDGGSNDNSVDIIKKYEDKIDWWVSEPDEGQSDAINKGFSKATGDFLTWVNSDDILLPGALDTVCKVVKENPSVQWIAGNTVWIDADGKIIRCSRLPHYSRLLSKMGFLVVGGPSTFFARSLYKTVKGLRLDLFFAMDIDLWWQFHNHGIYFYRIPKYLMAFRFHAGSKCSASSFASGTLKDEERRLMLEKKKREEVSLLIDLYGNRRLLPLAKVIYRCKQTLNGNYLKAWLDLRKMQGHLWQQIFPIDSESGRNLVDFNSEGRSY